MKGNRDNEEPIEIDTDGCLDTIVYASVLVFVFVLAVVCKF